MIKEQLLERERGIERDIKEAKLAIRNVLCILIDFVGSDLGALTDRFYRLQSYVDIVQVHHLSFLNIVVGQLGVLGCALARLSTLSATFAHAAVGRWSQRPTPPTFLG